MDHTKSSSRPPVAVIVGASSGVGRALSRRFARAGYHLVLVSRDLRDVSASAADLQLRFGVQCWPVAQDIADGTWDVTMFAATCHERFGSIDALLVPAGGSVSGDEGANPRAVQTALGANYVGPARLAAAFGSLMAQQGGGSIVLFSSIAAAAARTRNVAYSASKAALETYATGLRHALHGRGVEVLVLALGYVDSAQTFGMRLPFPVAKADDVAERVLHYLHRKTGGRHYFPWFWWWVTMVLRYLPWFLYRRLKF